MFAYATSHFLSHATGVFGLVMLDAIGRRVLLAPWQTLPGHTVVFASLFIHGGLGLRALHRRRHLRIPAAEAWQLALGLCLPLLLIPHAVDVRLGKSLFGFEDSYFRILYYYWLTAPTFGLARQFVLLFFAWGHGCIGLHFWLRYRPWYTKVSDALRIIAFLVPSLAVLGLVNAGWDTAMKSALTAGFGALHGPPPVGSPRALESALLQTIWEWAQATYVALVLFVLASRLYRSQSQRRRGRVKVTYPGARTVTVPRGFSVLEASRWSRIPHASVCGGRARCSTCRIRVNADGHALPEPSSIERETLERIAAPPNVRLACQLRPTRDIAVAPLLPADMARRRIPTDGDVGCELQITALFVDLRDSTRLAAGRLPFDALFLADRYVQRIVATVGLHTGHVTNIAGDGIMAVFGLRGADMDAVGWPPDLVVGVGRPSTGSAAHGALKAPAAAIAICDDLDALSLELRDEIEMPLSFGIGLHAGWSAVGRVVDVDRPSMLFLGDVGNVASRLESLTKEHSCRIIASESVFQIAGRDVPIAIPLTEVRLRGREALPLRIAVIDRDMVQALSRSLGP